MFYWMQAFAVERVRETKDAVSKDVGQERTFGGSRWRQMYNRCPLTDFLKCS